MEQLTESHTALLNKLNELELELEKCRGELDPVVKELALRENPIPTTVTRPELWKLLPVQNAIVNKRQGLMWAIFTVFTAGNVGLATVVSSQEYNSSNYGLVLSIIGFLTSFVWLRGQWASIKSLTTDEESLRKTQTQLGLPIDFQVSVRHKGGEKVPCSEKNDPKPLCYFWDIRNQLKILPILSCILWIGCFSLVLHNRHPSVWNPFFLCG